MDRPLQRVSEVNWGARKTPLSVSVEMGFSYDGMEVATAAAHKIPVLWIVLKNNQLGMITTFKA